MLFQGSGTALVTPFRDGFIDWDAFAKLIAYQLKAGTAALIVCGTTGEPSTMSAQEERDVVSFAMKHVDGKIPVIAGCGGNDTAAVVKTAREFEKLGVDGLLAVTPYYNKTTQAGLVAHYRKIADATDLPIIVYNVPSRTGLNLEPSTMKTLSEHPNIVGLKEASGDLTQIMNMFRLVGDDVAIYSGNDDQVFPMLALGGKGVITVAGNVIPAQMQGITDLFFKNHQVDSLRLQQHLIPFINQLFCQVSPIPVKAALAKMGLIENELRLPLVPMSEEDASGLFEEMHKLRLLWT